MLKDSILDNLFARRKVIVNKSEQEVGFFEAEYCFAIENFELREVFPDVILFNFEEAKKVNRRLFADFPWVKGVYFQIGQSGQGDFWLLDVNGRVSWFDHDKGEISLSGVLSFEIGFLDFLKMSIVVRDAERSLDHDPVFFDKNKNRDEYIKSMMSVGSKIYDLYPYKYF